MCDDVWCAKMWCVIYIGDGDVYVFVAVSSGIWFIYTCICISIYLISLILHCVLGHIALRTWS